jgi:hypothetical protein
MFRSAALLTVALLPALPALADPATPDGAARIAAALGRYLPQPDTVLSITPQGDTYRLRVALDGYLALIPENAGNASISPFDAVLTDMGGGRWQLDYDQPFKMSVEVPGALTVDLALAGMKGRATFDEALGAFVENSGEATGMTMDETFVDPAGGAGRVVYRLDRMTYESTSVRGTEGGLDTRARYEAAGLFEAFSVPAPGSPMKFTLTAGSYSADLGGSDIRTPELLAIAAFLVAHPSEQALKADESGLKSVLRAALPIFGDIDMTGTMKSVSLQTMVGEFTADTLSFGIGANGAVKDGRFREAIGFTGLTLPSGLVPDYAKALLPKDGSIGFEVSGFDAAAMADVVLDGLTLSGPASSDLGARIGAVALPGGALNVMLEDGGLAGAGYDLTWTGTMTAGPQAMPTGTGTVTLSGIESILTTLRAGPPEASQGGAAAVAMARGLGRIEGERVVWDVEATTDGRLLVNGNDLSPLIGR